MYNAAASSSLQLSVDPINASLIDFNKAVYPGMLSRGYLLRRTSRNELLCIITIYSNILQEYLLLCLGVEGEL